MKEKIYGVMKFNLKKDEFDVIRITFKSKKKAENYIEIEEKKEKERLLRELDLIPTKTKFDEFEKTIKKAIIEASLLFCLKEIDFY